MRKPSESLDEHIVRPAPSVVPKPPRAVSLRRTGDVEVLRPLTPLEVRAEPARSAFKALRSPNPLWFRRFLAAGSGALVIITLALVSAILVGINDPADWPDVAASVKPNDEPTQFQELFNLEVSPPSPVAPETWEVLIARSNPRRKPIRQRVHVAAIKPKPQIRPAPEAELPKFVPTTLVIYAENGVINTRIEPWIQFSN